jgi:hypothetical protein
MIAPPAWHNDQEVCVRPDLANADHLVYGRTPVDFVPAEKIAKS